MLINLILACLACLILTAVICCMVASEDPRQRMIMTIFYGVLFPAVCFLVARGLDCAGH